MFRSMIPIASLQPYIESIWYCNRYVKETEQTITLPFGRMEMVIPFSGTYSISYDETVFRGDHPWVSGHQTKPTVTTIAGQHECMGIVFTPLGWSSFSRISADLLVNMSVAADITGMEIGLLCNELAETDPVENKFTKLQQFLSQKILSPYNLSVTREVLQIIRSARHERKITVTYLCKQMKISRKSLNQHFRKYIGLSASSYLQQMIFNDVIAAISKLPQERLTGIGLDHHFFDQSHFIKQFHSFAGMTPGQYLQSVKNNNVHPAFPNFLSC